MTKWDKKRLYRSLAKSNRDYSKHILFNSLASLAKTIHYSIVNKDISYKAYIQKDIIEAAIAVEVCKAKYGLTELEFRYLLDKRLCDLKADL